MKLGVAVEESPKLAGVRVQIQDHIDASCCFFNALPNLVHYWVQQLSRVFPTSIGVSTHQLAASISVDHSVGVNHRHNFEYEVVLEIFCRTALSNKKVDYSFHYEAGGYFSRVLSGYYPDYLLLL